MHKTTDNTPALEAVDQKMAMSIDKLNISGQTRTTLLAAKITTVQDIIDTESAKGILRVRNIGKTHRLEIQNALEKVGLSLDGSEALTEETFPAGVVQGKTDVPEQAVPQAQAIVPEAAPAPEPNPPTQIAGSVPIPTPVVQAEPPQLKTVVFVDYEHWFASLRNLHGRRPNIQTWFSDLKTRGRLLEVTFFGDFSESGGMKNEIANIRMYSNRIIETKNPSDHSKKDFTDFIMLDNIYQKVIASPDVEQVVLFTGDGHFSSVASYLRNFCSKVVGVYGVDNAISGQLEAISDWCVRIPFVNEPYMECRAAILKNLKHAEDHTKSPTFQSTVRLVAERYELPDDAVEAELKRMINEGVVYTVSERSHWDYKVMLNILKVNWSLAGKIE